MKFPFSSSIVLENDLVRIEPLTDETFNDLIPVSINHPNLLKYSPSPFGGKEGLKAYFQQAKEDLLSKTRYPFAIFDKQNKRFVGSTSFGFISDVHQRLEIGWTWISPETQGSGLNKQGKFLLLEYAFETLDMERVAFCTDLRNVQSQKAIEKIGGKREGVFRNHVLMLDGYRRDTVYYSIVKQEWPELKESVFAHFKSLTQSE